MTEKPNLVSSHYHALVPSRDKKAEMNGEKENNGGKKECEQQQRRSRMIA